MKKIIITAAASIACLLLSVSPGLFLTSTAQVGTDTATWKQQASVNTQRILSIYKGIESGDLSAMDEFVSANVVDHAGTGDIQGLANVKKMLGDIRNHFTNMKFTLISDGLSADGMYHFSLVRMTGTTKDDTMGMPANTPVDRITVDVVRLQNDKAVEHWGFEDSREMMKMMNMMKK